MDAYPVIRPGPSHDAQGVRIRYGGCSCGAVRFEVRGEPVAVGVCHCTECRKATGCVSMAYADWPRSAFSLTGEAREYQGRSFCPICGSRVFHPGTEQIEVMLGALDDAPGDLSPTHEGWIIRREHWQPPIPGAGQFERDPQ